jgi:hypothetical protein
MFEDAGVPKASKDGSKLVVKLTSDNLSEVGLYGVDYRYGASSELEGPATATLVDGRDLTQPQLQVCREWVLLVPGSSYCCKLYVSDRTHASGTECHGFDQHQTNHNLAPSCLTWRSDQSHLAAAENA